MNPADGKNPASLQPGDYIRIGDQLAILKRNLEYQALVDMVEYDVYLQAMDAISPPVAGGEVSIEFVRGVIDGMRSVLSRVDDWIEMSENSKRKLQEDEQGGPKKERSLPGMGDGEISDFSS